MDTETKKRYVPRRRSLQPVVLQTDEERALEAEAMQTLVRVCNGEDRMDATPPEIDVDSELDSQEDRLVAMIDWKRSAERHELS